MLQSHYKCCKWLQNGATKENGAAGVKDVLNVMLQGNLSISKSPEEIRENLSNFLKEPDEQLVDTDSENVPKDFDKGCEFKIRRQKYLDKSFKELNEK